MCKRAEEAERAGCCVLLVSSVFAFGDYHEDANGHIVAIDLAYPLICVIINPSSERTYSLERRVIHKVLQMPKRKSCTVTFDLSKILEAIDKAYQDEKSIKHEIEEFMQDYLDAEADAFYYAELERMRERQKRAKKHRIKLISALNALLASLWMRRNAGAGRSNTSAVSDIMLMTIPTPPTAVAANRSLRRGGVICANMG